MPAGPPPTSRIAAALGRAVSVLFRAFGLRRVLPVFAVVLAVAGITFAVPVVSDVVTSSSERAALDAASAEGHASSGAGRSAGSSSARSASGNGTVQMGVDGVPATDAPAETPAPAAPETPAAEEPETARAAAADEPTPAPSPAPATEEPRDEPAAPKASTPAPAPAPRPAPAPAPRPAPAPAAPAAPAAPGIEGQVLSLVNQARATAGCAPLAADSALAAVARAHSADMRDRDYFSHDTPEGLDPFDRAKQAGITYARAENIAYGQANATEVMDDWMTSPGHRENILDCELTKLGVGVAEGPGGPWWTQLFGA
ncbi:CAP domain-containing protein [Geodermatophilus sp. SYSU D00079]